MSKNFDVSISLTLQCVVRAQSPEDAEGLAIKLADHFSYSNQSLDGSTYGVDDVSEFSLNFAPETFESRIDAADDIED